MKIPASFKLGSLTVKVHLVEKIEIENDSIGLFDKTLKGGGFLFGVHDPTESAIYIATKDLNGKPMSQERLESTFYHELAHALVGDTMHQEANSDEIFIEALGKSLFSYISTVSDEEAVLLDESDEDEEVESEEVKPKKKSKK